MSERQLGFRTDHFQFCPIWSGCEFVFLATSPKSKLQLHTGLEPQVLPEHCDT